MGSFGLCRICGEKINYCPDDVANLGEHLLEKHPNQKIAHFTLLYEDVHVPGQCNCSLKDNKIRSKTFKTTIESWKQAQNPQKCLECGNIGVPLIRRQRHKLTKSPIGAYVLLGCWPICFLPFILGGSDLMYLYCKECGNYLGMFDRREGHKSEGIRIKNKARTCIC